MLLRAQEMVRLRLAGPGASYLVLATELVLRRGGRLSQTHPVDPARLAPPSLHDLCQLIHPTTLMTPHRWHRRRVLCPATAVTIPRADPAIFSSIRDHSHRRCGNQASRGDGLHAPPLIHEKGIYSVVFIDAEYAVELLAQALELGYAPSAYR